MPPLQKILRSIVMVALEMINNVIISIIKVEAFMFATPPFRAA
jgi:hypothetical protein